MNALIFIGVFTTIMLVTCLGAKINNIKLGVEALVFLVIAAIISAMLAISSVS
jgi:hypothetical protein